MKKFAFLTAFVAMSVCAHAAPAASTPPPAPEPVPAVSSSKAPALPMGIQAVGWDNNLKHITARVGLTENNAVDVGVGLNINSVTDEKELLLGGFYLLKLQDWGMIDNYAVAGASAVIAKEFGLTGFVGLQPEITLLDRIIVSVRFGVVMPIRPDFMLQTTGDPISIVNGMNFKIIW